MNRLGECTISGSARAFFISILLILPGSLLQGNALASPYYEEAVDLQELWEQKKVEPSCTVQDWVKDEWSKLHVILVPGIVHELPRIFSLYFKAQSEVLKEVFGTTVSFANPGSTTSTVDNVEIINQQALRMFDETGKPGVLVGHSKGGAEAFLTAIKHPELILEGKLAFVLLIQASIKGTSIADRMNYVFRFFGRFLGSGFESLRREQAEKNIADALAEMERKLQDQYGPLWEDKRNEISNRIFYIRSKEDYKNLGFAARFAIAVAGAVNTEESDGLLLKDEQFHPDIGEDLGIVNADHVGLIISGLSRLQVSPLTEHDRRAFSRALFQRAMERINAFKISTETLAISAARSLETSETLAGIDAQNPNDGSDANSAYETPLESPSDDDDSISGSINAVNPLSGLEFYWF